MNDQPSARRTSKKDDLTVIKGIREARQRILRQALSVQTYDDLANSAPEDILMAFKAAGQSIARASVESWIAEARRLAATRSKANAKQYNSRSAKSQSVALFFLEFLTPQELGQTPAYSTRVHYMEQDWDEVIEGIDPLIIWSHMSDVLNEKAPHLARALKASVEAHMAEKAAPGAPPRRRPRIPTPADSPQEKRLRDALREVERVVGNPVGAGTFQSAATLTPLSPTKRTPGLVAAPMMSAPAQADVPSNLEATGDRLQYYLHKYGMGVEEARVPQPQAQTQRTETAVKPGDNIEEIKLARYIARYGRV